MGKKLIAICVPTLGEVGVHWAINYSLLSSPMNISSLRLFKINLPVAEARNALVQSAFDFAERDKMDLSHIFWLDDDVIVQNWAMIHLYTRKVPIVSGVYFTKDDYAQPLMFAGPGEGVMEFKPDMYEPIWGHGMGLTLVEADVYRRMKAELDLGVDGMGNPAWYYTHDKTPMKDTGQESNILSMTEDFFFITNAHKLGYQPMIDTHRPAFGFHYNRKLQQGYPKKQFDEYKTKGTITWDTPNGPVVWQG